MKGPIRALDRWVQADGIRLHLLDWGGGGEGEPLVFLAGYGNTPHVFDDLARRLFAGRRIVGLTRRGHGRSEQPPSGYDTRSLASDIVRVLDALCFDRAVLVGHSFAGHEMTCVAAEYPDRVSGLVYLDALYPLNDERIALMMENPTRATSAPPEAFSSVAAYSEDFVTRYAAYRRLRSPEWDRLMGYGLERTTDGQYREILRPESGQQLLQGSVDYGLPLTAIRCPVLAVYAFQDESWLLGDHASEELREATRQYVERLHRFVRGWEETVRQEIRDVTIVELEDTSHYCFLDREADVEEAIGAFLG